jgi:hypothetical protein
VSERPDHNAAPEQAVIASRKDHYREIAPDRGAAKDKGKDFCD